VEAVADAVVVTAATEIAEQAVRMGADYVVVHLNLSLCSFHYCLVADVVVVTELEIMGRNQRWLYSM
jgi:putative NIF3 family GTP cyclohydrolase 1 type 2